MKIYGITKEQKFEVAIFMFSYNHQKYLMESIDSILNQKFNKSWHIFIHDDVSTDETIEILKMYYEKFPDKITLVLQDENQFSKGKSIGIDLFKNSNSETIAFCEVDDLWIYKKKMKKQHNFIVKNQGEKHKCSKT
jgi:glycosyltransferase involved in cell wall biosynthesis